MPITLKRTGSAVYLYMYVHLVCDAVFHLDIFCHIERVQKNVWFVEVIELHYPVQIRVFYDRIPLTLQDLTFETCSLTIPIRLPLYFVTKNVQ